MRGNFTSSGQTTRYQIGRKSRNSEPHYSILPPCLPNPSKKRSERLTSLGSRETQRGKGARRWGCNPSEDCGGGGEGLPQSTSVFTHRQKKPLNLKIILKNYLNYKRTSKTKKPTKTKKKQLKLKLQNENLPNPLRGSWPSEDGMFRQRKGDGGNLPQ